jgi:hypothetical protein
MYIQLVDRFIDDAIVYQTDSTLNSTQSFSRLFEDYISNIDVPTKQEYYTISTKNIAVLSFKLTNFSSISTGFVQKSIDDKHNNNNATQMVLVNDATKINFNKIETSAFLDQNLLKTFENQSTSPIFSFTVYDTSILFDIDSSILQQDFNCTEKYSNQIITSVVSVSSSQNLTSLNKKNRNFVKTFFKAFTVNFKFFFTRF